ncbi:hypothetical protein LOTGIDRAFT_157466 [Lottia gigantea]|uniref:C2H2-type domain-containing protein n=1 Tax=Lottia gigantea TaxID=225164 RepID=V4AVC8_LOTGI|nr:hypothetical protein LOTGIDRAFT_157466 [Lottia gigantea]ESP01288.1 hypothetical protein LOTGIDRAFT_157466 [Lottia gigantea]
MTLKTEPMEMEGNEDMFRMRSFTRSIIPKSFDLTDDQKAMRLPSPDEPFITGIFHRGSEQMANQSYNMLRSDVSAMQQGHYFGGDRVKTSPTPPAPENKDEEYPTYTIARSELELNSRLLPKKYKCKFCVYKTSYKSDLNRHLRRHAKKDNIYNCDVCNLPFRSISKVYSHRQQCHGESSIVKEESPLACTMCNFKCAEKDIDLFQLHIQKHIEENTCDICNKSFNSKAAVEKHKKIYHQVTNEVVFPSQPIRSVDMSYIPEASRNANYSGMNSSMLDLDSDHSPAGGSSASNSCDGSTNSTPVPFRQYSKGMNIRSILQRREKQNGDDSRMKDVNRSPSKANNDFSDKSAQLSKNLYDLKNPQKERENIPEISSAENGNECRSYKCGKCASIFLDVRDLFIHMSVCLQEEVSVKTANFNCPICSFTSEELNLFTSHMIRHTVDKFSCDLCNRPFSNFRNVLSHKRKVHKVDLRCKRSPTKIKFIGQNKSSPKSLSAKSNNPPYSKETIGDISNMADEESKKETMETDTELKLKRPSASVESQTSSQGQLTLGSIGGDVKDTLTSGRYAKLISDFDDFTLKPFACSLCFYRTEDLIDLKSHVENHVGNKSHPNFVKLNFESLSEVDSIIKTKDYVYDIAMSSDSNCNQNPVNFTFNDTINGATVIYPKESQNHTKQIRYLEKLLKKTQSKSKNNFLSRTRKHQALPNIRSFPCKICKKEFSMHILAKRHLVRIHNVTK